MEQLNEILNPAKLSRLLCVRRSIPEIRQKFEDFAARPSLSRSRLAREKDKVTTSSYYQTNSRTRMQWLN
jgi:hypothetical protein